MNGPLLSDHNSSSMNTSWSTRNGIPTMPSPPLLQGRSAACGALPTRDSALQCSTSTSSRMKALLADAVRALPKHLPRKLLPLLQQPVPLRRNGLPGVPRHSQFQSQSHPRKPKLSIVPNKLLRTSPPTQRARLSKTVPFLLFRRGPGEVTP